MGLAVYVESIDWQRDAADPTLLPYEQGKHRIRPIRQWSLLPSDLWSIKGGKLHVTLSGDAIVQAVVRH